MEQYQRDGVGGVENARRWSMSRRALIRLVSAGFGSAAAGALLAACGGGSTPAANPTQTTSGAASTAGPTPSGQSTTAAGGTPAKPATGGQVSVLWRSPVSLSPLFSTAGSEQQVERLIFGALVKMNDKLEPVPDLAQKVEVSPDATTYAFALQKNAKFTDGPPLTSKDVRFTFERAIDKRTGSYWRGRLSKIAGAADYSDQKADSVSGIETPDDYTVNIVLASADAALLVTLCNFSGFGILPEHVLKDVAPAELQKHPFSLAPNVSAGAFKFVKYETDQYLELARNDTYWGSPAPLDRIFLRILTGEVALAQLQTGDMDVISIAVQDIQQVQQMQNATFVSVKSPSMDFLAINMGRDFLQDKRVRQAMMYAIDREGILKEIFGGQGEVTNSPIFGPAWMGIPEGLNAYNYDVNKAKQLLQDASWDSNREVEILHTPGISKERDTAVQIIQNQWSDVGLKAKIVQVDAAEGNRRVIQSTNFDVRTVGGGVFRADPGVSGTYMTTRTFTPAGGNYGHYSNPEVDKLYDQAQAAGNVADRKQLYIQVAKILNEELPWIFLYSPNSLYGVSKRLVGYAAPSYIDNKLWNAETWSIKA